MFTVTKTYRDLPAAHRQPKHDGHCRLIHGHNWSFDITFTCDVLDENGFVVDVGKLGEVKKLLGRLFDHTLLINKDDPLLGMILTWPASVTIVPNCGMEGLAKFVFEAVVALLDNEVFAVAFERNLRVVEVTCWEDSKNRATYHNRDAAGNPVTSQEPKND